MVTKAIFWDNDGVLVETEQIYFEATRDVLAEVEIDLTPALYKELFLVQGRGAWHLVAEKGFSAEEQERMRTDRNNRYSRGLGRTPPLVDGVRDVLETLRGKYVMGCVTSSRKDHFDLIHRDTGLLQYFDFIITASDVTRVKPDPELYRLAVSRTGFEPSECVAIEDSARGLEAANAAGIRCLVVPTALTHGSAFTGAQRVLERMEEVVAAVSAPFNSVV